LARCTELNIGERGPCQQPFADAFHLAGNCGVLGKYSAILAHRVQPRSGFRPLGRVGEPGRQKANSESVDGVSSPSQDPNKLCANWGKSADSGREADFSFPIHSVCAQHPRCAQEPLRKSRSPAGTTSRLIQHGEVLLQTALLGTVPLLELSQIVLLR